MDIAFVGFGTSANVFRYPGLNQLTSNDQSAIIALLDTLAYNQVSNVLFGAFGQQPNYITALTLINNQVRHRHKIYYRHHFFIYKSLIS